MEQWTTPTSQPNSARERREPDAFHSTALPASQPPQDTERQTSENQSQSREKLQLLWGELLQAAVRDPGLILDAYSRFHGYSLGNRLAALWQCHTRGLEPGPIHTYQGWKQLGYQVKSGEKALWLCMPLTRPVSGDGKTEKPYRNGKSHKADIRANGSTTGSESTANEDEAKTTVISAFVWKPHWFVLSQTEPMPGQEVGPLETPPLGVWHKAKALQTLGISEIPFDLLDGNCQGYAQGRTIAVSPLAALPYKTLFHEMAHIVLGHTQQEACVDGAQLPEPQPRYLREAEAEATALLLFFSGV